MWSSFQQGQIICSQKAQTVILKMKLNVSKLCVYIEYVLLKYMV